MKKRKTKKITGVQHTTSALAIKPDKKKPVLSKQQRQFNESVILIEELRKALLKTEKSLDDKKQFYADHITATEKKLLLCNTEAVKILYGYYTKQSFSKKQQGILSSLISDKLSGISEQMTEEPGQDIKEIFKAIEGISFKEMQQQEFEYAREAMDEMFKENGFDINTDHLKGDLSEEEMLRKTIEIQEQIKEQAEAKEREQSNRKKTKKQLAQEKKEQDLQQARKKNIGTIYKQLAKLFHPDLEQDEDLRIKKGELMQQLTVAYKANDLHSLLSLELAWINKEEHNAMRTNEELAIYNEVLQEQVFELEMELETIYEQPRYQVLHRLVPFPQMLKGLNMKEVKQEKEMELIEAEHEFSQLKKPAPVAIAFIKRCLKEHELFMEFEMEFDDDLPF